MLSSLSPPTPSLVNRNRCPVNETGRLSLPKSSKLLIGPRRTGYSSSRLRMSTGNGGVGMNPPGGVGEKDGVIIVDHGSRRRESNLMLNEFVNMFRDKTGYPIVEPAHMELAEPSIRDAFGACVRQGAIRVIVSPFFLFPGRHWHQDIPALTAEAAKDHPGVSYIVAAPLGLHELLVDVVNDRIKYCLSHVAGDAEECAVCAGTGKCKLY
ncbi:hypothetical protein Tsubulata_004733 [Turnera subulata]|uniref:Sirohydrochlorin ferrochelatase n=1 Tax=Turnera subulata TaxID=218843 RepID=A0A9Q0FJH2_9ROSI|nr:hypothetical protein Tsubulata_004733 [Turnera subulata]